LWAIFALLDPDPDRIPNPDPDPLTRLNPDPDPHPCFQAPQSFLDNFVRLTGRTGVAALSAGSSALPQGASLPTLGLSNKAVYAGEKVLSEEERHVKDQYPDFYFTPEVW
jgi:hypothetical protein